MIFSRLSIFQKMLIAPLPALLLFAVFTLYIYNQQSVSKEFLHKIESHHFPVVTISKSNVMIINSAIECFNTSLERNDFSNLMIASQYKKNLYENLQKLHTLLDKKIFYRSIESSFLNYFNSAITLSQTKDKNQQKKLIEKVHLSLFQTKDILDNFYELKHKEFLNTIEESNEYNKQTFRLGVVLGVVSLIFILLTTLFISFSTKESLSQLYKSIKNIADGKPDFSKRLEQQSNDELGKLVKEFNKFTQKLEMDYKELEISKEEAESATKTKSEFIANMSHEIRTPLNAVIGFAELLERTEVDKKQQSYLKSIKAGGKALLAIINDILDLSKIEADKLEIHYEAVSLYALVQEIVTIFKPKANEKGVKLKLNILSEIPSFLLLDETRVRQVLFNLVGNAIKFTHSGCIEIGIVGTLCKKSVDSIKLRIDVIDTGIGIPKEQQEKIFESFVQQEGQSNRQYGGTGLGLAICLKLMRMMEGELRVISQLGCGSTFSMILFKVKKVNKLVKNIELKEYAPIEFKGSKILIADDIDTNRELIIKSLEKENLELFSAKDGKEAIEIIQKVDIDLVLMDIKMPIMNGIEASRWLKSNHKFSKIPIIVITASVSSKDIKELNSLFENYLLKPISPNLLKQEIAQFLPHIKGINIRPKESIENSLELYIEKGDQKLFLENFDNELGELWSIASKGWSLEDTLVFTEALEEFGFKYNQQCLVDFAHKLNNITDEFDIQKLEENLKLFSDMLIDIKDKNI